MARKKSTGKHATGQAASKSRKKASSTAKPDTKTKSRSKKGTKAGEPTAEQIAARAYAIWQQQGQPPDQDQQHWLEAEAQLKAEQASD